MSDQKSKAQVIYDRLIKARDSKSNCEFQDAVIDAIKLLADGEAQLMGDVDGLRHANTYRTDIPIGSRK